MIKFFIFLPYIILVFFLFNDSFFLNLFLKFDISLFNINIIKNYFNLFFNFCLFLFQTLLNIFYYIIINLYNFIIILIFSFFDIYFFFIYYILFVKIGLILIYNFIKNIFFFVCLNFFVPIIINLLYNLLYLILYIFISIKINLYENDFLLAFYHIDLIITYLINLRSLFYFDVTTIYIYFYFLILHKILIILLLKKFFLFNFVSLYFVKFIYNASLMHIFLIFYILILNVVLKIKFFFFYFKYIYLFKNIIFFLSDFVNFFIKFLYLNFNFLLYYFVKNLTSFIIKTCFYLFLLCIKIIPIFFQTTFIFIIFSFKTFLFDCFFFINNFLKLIIFIFIQILRFGFDFMLHDSYITNIPLGNKDYLDNDFHIDYNLFKRLEITGFSYLPYFKTFYTFPANKLIADDISVINNELNLDNIQYDIIIDFKKLKRYPYFKQTMTPNEFKNFFNYFHLSQNNTIHLHYLLNTGYYITKEGGSIKDPITWLQHSFFDFLIKRKYIPKFRYTYFNYNEIFNNLNNLSWSYLLTTLKSSYISFILLKINLNLIFLLFLFISMFLSWFYYFEWIEYQLIEKDHFNFANYIIDNILIIRNKPLKKILMKNSFLLELFLFLNIKNKIFIFKNFNLYKLILIFFLLILLIFFFIIN